jgi:polyisoprenyl-phosphate glycosyltransferase
MYEPQISFIIPLYNEAVIFPKLIERLNQFTRKLDVTYEIVMIDDGSDDETPLLLRQLALIDEHYNCIVLSRNFGHQYAVSAGLHYSRAKEAVMILDGDLQDPPELFFEFYSHLRQGFDVVYGVRKKRKEGLMKRISYYLFYRIINKITAVPISLDAGDFSLISKRVKDIINKMPEESRFLRGMRSWIGFSQKGIEYERDSRVGGESKYTWKKLFSLAYDGIFNFSFFPLKFLTISGSFCLVASMLYFIITLFRRYLYDDVPIGFTALLFMIIFFGGIQLLSIGIVGEYVSRTFLQVKNRPLFVVKEQIKDGKLL